MKKAFLLTYNKGNILEGFNYVKFHKKLTEDPNIISWWHYLDNTYILITEQNINSDYFSNLFIRIGNNKFMFVCEININNTNGLLPREAWDWIKKFQYSNNPFIKNI